MLVLLQRDKWPTLFVRIRTLLNVTSFTKFFLVSLSNNSSSSKRVEPPGELDAQVDLRAADVEQA